MTGSQQSQLRPVDLLLIFVGGALGTGLREIIGFIVPPFHDIPYATMAINVAGAFLLGALLAFLSDCPDHGSRRVMRLLIGTGLLGGFTTYSAVALDTVTLLTDDRPGIAVAYALGTVLLGATSAWLGISCTVRARGRTGERT